MFNVCRRKNVRNDIPGLLPYVHRSDNPLLVPVSLFLRIHHLYTAL